MYKLIKYKKEYDLIEAFQSLDVRFAFVNKERKQITAPSCCRDFLGDCLWSRLTKSECCIYGFCYDYKKAPYDLDTLRLSIEFPSEEQYENFRNNFIHVQYQDKKAGCKESILYLTDKPLTVVVEADKNWQEAIWKLSLYTFYLKLACYADNLSLESPEDEYITTLKKGEHRLLSKVTTTNTETIYEDLGFSHNRSGFVSILEGRAHSETIKNVMKG